MAAGAATAAGAAARWCIDVSSTSACSGGMVAAQQSCSEHAGCVVENTASMQVAAAACESNQKVVEAVVVSVGYKARTRVDRVVNYSSTQLEG